MDRPISKLVKNIEDQLIGFFREGLLLNQLVNILVSAEFLLDGLTLLEENQVVVGLEVIGILLGLAEIRGGHFDFLLAGDPCVFDVLFESSRQFGGFHHLLEVLIGQELAIRIVEEVSCHIEETDEVLHRQGAH